MNWEPKAWGETCELLRTDSMSVHSIHFNYGTSSSWHYHDRQSNRILCREGMLRVQSKPSWIDRVLLPGESITIPAGIVHRFYAITDGKAWETYHGDCRSVDITRVG